jgi:hypothetical protein
MSLGPIATIRAIRNFLFSKTNREFLIFLFFLLVAGLFWLMMTLNETFETEVKFYVRYVHVPQNVVLTSGDIDSVRVNVRDKGFSLFSFIHTQDPQPVDIDFNKYAGTNGTGYVSAIDLQRLFEHRLPASAKITSVKIERLVFYYNHGEQKKVPVRWRGHITPDPHYFLSKTIITPDSVTVFSSHEKLDSIDYVYTEELNYADFHDTLFVQSRLHGASGIKIVPQKVSITFLTDILTEERIDSIPVVGINMPEGKVLRTFPSRISVKIVTGMKNYRALTPADFVVVADYKQFADNKASKCPIQLKRIPEGISKAVLEVNQVDYLIEEK